MGHAGRPPVGSLEWERLGVREVLGDTVFESLAHAGATMTTAEMANYAFRQIDQARTELEQVR